MKGEVRQIGDHLDQIEKGFKIEIEPPEEIEREIKVVKAIKNQDNIFNQNEGLQKYEQQEKFVFKPLKNDDKEFDTKSSSQGNPIQIFSQTLNNNIKEKYPNDYKLIQLSDRSFLYDFFKSAKDLSDKVIEEVMNMTRAIIIKFYKAFFI